MNKERGSTLSDLLAPSRSVGSRLSWGRWQWPSTAAVGKLGQPVARGSWLAVGHQDRLWRMQRGLKQAAYFPRCRGRWMKQKRGDKMVRDCPVWLHLRVLHKILRAIALHSMGWTQHFHWSIFHLLSNSDLRKMMDACLKEQKYSTSFVWWTSGHIICLGDNSIICAFCEDICFYYISQVLERSMSLHTYAIWTIGRDWGLYAHNFLGYVPRKVWDYVSDNIIKQRCAMQ